LRIPRRCIFPATNEIESRVAARLSFFDRREKVLRDNRKPKIDLKDQLTLTALKGAYFRFRFNGAGRRRVASVVCPGLEMEMMRKFVRVVRSAGGSSLGCDDSEEGHVIFALFAEGNDREVAR
jgi:hypothetical protein